MRTQIQICDALPSTNDRLKDLAQWGAPEGTVIIAKEQTSGKGRLGRRWDSPRGGAWFSLLLRPPISVEQAGCIAILIAVSLARALREGWGMPVGVKWPNDLYVRGKKLGGVLIELSSRLDKIEWLVVGIGVNVNNALPTEARVPPTSLACELGRPVPLEEFFERALAAIAHDYERFLSEGFEFVRQRWQGLSVLPPRISVRTSTEEISAQVLGLAPSGRLIVRTDEGLRELKSEEVTLCPL
jgi:BirA family biotin operon repressor/biotin-[acetyl-CoA-carboxylase] ligase